MKDAALICYETINDIWEELEGTLENMCVEGATANNLLKFLKAYIHGLHESSNTLETKLYSARIYGVSIEGE